METHHRKFWCRALVALTVAAALLLTTGCAAPKYAFVTSGADDVVIKIPRTWSVVRSGPPVSSDGSQAPEGSWVAVLDASDKPKVEHLSSLFTADPVAMARTWVVTKASVLGMTSDDLRDLLMPFTSRGRQLALTTGSYSAKILNSFHAVSDTPIQTRSAKGIHIVFSYDFGLGAEFFDQIAMTDAKQTRLHMVVVHCSKKCFDLNHETISAVMRSVTVKTP